MVEISGRFFTVLLEESVTTTLYIFFFLQIIQCAETFVRYIVKCYDQYIYIHIFICNMTVLIIICRFFLFFFYDQRS